MKNALKNLILKEKLLLVMAQNEIHRDNRNRFLFFLLNKYSFLRFKLLKIFIKNFHLKISNTLYVLLSIILEKGDSFMDVGANIGCVTDKASWLVGRDGNVYSFEPSPTTMILLSKRIKGLNLKNVHLSQFALGSKESDGLLHEFKENFGGSSSLAYGLDTAPRQTLIGKTVIKIDTLDNFIHVNNVEKIKMIKIDVQGFEIDVLDGARELLLSAQPPILFVEVEKGALEAFNYSCSDLINKILSFNYKIFSLRNKVLFTIENINDIPIEGHDDVICFNLNIKDHLLYFNNLLKLCTKV
jgi:FkbM family methyltransferase